MLHGNKVRAYKAAYGQHVKDESARVRGSNLLKDYYIKKRLCDSWKQVQMGIEEDKMAFIDQELKLITIKIITLLAIHEGSRQANPGDMIRAMKMDSELAEQEAQFRNYGSLKSGKMNEKQAAIQLEADMKQTPGIEKNENSVTNRNIRKEKPLLIPVKIPIDHKPVAICAGNNIGEAVDTEHIEGAAPCFVTNEGNAAMAMYAGPYANAEQGH